MTVSIYFRLRVGDNLKVRVESTQTVDAIYAVVTGQMRMHHKPIHRPSKGTNFDFEQKVTRDMVPSLNIIVYYLHEDKEIVYDRLTVGVESSLMNHVRKKSVPGF